MLLVEYDKASAPGLKAFLQEQLVEMRYDAEENFRKRQGLNRTTWSQEFIAVFYSSWHFPALYCALALDGPWTLMTLSHRLGIDEERVNQVMIFFQRHNIVECRADSSFNLTRTGFVAVDGRDKDSHKAAVLHNCKNFRQKAMSVMEGRQLADDKGGIFHTNVALVSKKDLEALKKESRALLDSFNRRVSSGQFEEIVVLNVDCFGL